MRGIVKVALALVLIVRAAQGEEPATANARLLYEQGVKQYNLGLFNDSLKSFQGAYMAKPDPAFLFNIGQCHRQLGDYKQEIYAYKRFLAERPDTPNRKDVEGFIAAAEEELQRKSVAAPPTSPMAPAAASVPEAPAKVAPPELTTPVATPVAPAAPASVATPAPTPSEPASTPVYKKWWLWAGVGAVVAAGAAVAIAVAAGGTTSPDHPGDTAGSAIVRF